MPHSSEQSKKIPKSSKGPYVMLEYTKIPPHEHDYRNSFIVLVLPSGGFALSTHRGLSGPPLGTPVLRAPVFPSLYWISKDAHIRKIYRPTLSLNFQMCGTWRLLEYIILHGWPRDQSTRRGYLGGRVDRSLQMKDDRTSRHATSLDVEQS